jgi:hypothetical protein
VTGHFPTFDLEQNVISVDPSCDCSCFQSVQHVLGRKLGFQPSRKLLSTILVFGRAFNDLPRSQHLDIGQWLNLKSTGLSLRAESVAHTLMEKDRDFFVNARRV